jgi:hypothetical protein
MLCEFRDGSRWVEVLMTRSTMIWGGESLVISCMSDPHCREDFPEEDNPSKIEGVIPSWKMMTATYVSPLTPNETESADFDSVVGRT